MTAKEDLLKEIEELEQKINEIDTKIRELEKLKSPLFLRQCELRRNLDWIEMEDRTTAWVQSINDINLENSTLCSLDRDTTTVDLMDSFFYSKKKFLLLTSGNYNFFMGPKYVVTRDPGNIDVTYSSLTMTDLKKFIMGYTTEEEMRREIKGSRYYELFQELLKIDEGRKRTFNERVAFEKPCRLGAQIRKNRTGYGSYWEGGECIDEGTLYGDTTGFLIIGVIY